MSEEYLPNPTGGRKGGSYPDLTFESPDGSRIRFNTYDSNVNGLPSPREADAADRLFRNGGGSPVVPYQNENACHVVNDKIDRNSFYSYRRGQFL